MASVEAVLHTYQPGAGAIIEVDNGTYTLFDTIYLSTLDSGVTITGPTTGAAVVNRNNNNDLVFNLLDGANNLTITNLSITGGSTGINTDEVSLGNANITIANNIIYANTGSGYSGGIYAYNGSNWIVTGNTVHDNPGFYGGIYLQNSTGTVSNNIVYNERYDIYLSAPSNAPLSNVVSGNTVYGASYGIDVDNATVKNNIVHDNTVYGIYADTGSFITGNSVYRQTTSGAYGIEMSTATANNNTVYDNYIGIYTTGGGAHIYGNRVYSNLDDGLSLNNLSGTNSGGGYNYVATVYDNLIYANAQTGIYLTGDQDLTLLNNTIYQLAGDAIEFGSANTTYPTTVENNIIWVQAGYDLRLDSGVAAASVVSDYNDLYHTGANAKVGLLSGTAYSTLAAWQTASSKDAHSTEANPNFVDPTGADAVLGYNNSTAYNGGPDDDFFLLAGSPAIGAGNLAVRPATDALGYPWNTTDLGAFAYRAAASAATTPATVTSLVPGAGPGGLGIDTITVTFSQPVNDVDANAPSLYSLISAGPDGIFGTSDDISYPLTPAYTAGSQQVVLSVAGGTLSPGQYQLTIFSNSASSIHNLAGLELDGDNNGTPGGNYVTIITVSPSVVGRYVFYNDSSFDGNNVAANSADDAAIATDKQALLPGNNATFANYTSYSNGINGIMIDILGLPSTSLGIADFSFLVDSSATPTTWTSAPTPQSITVRPGAGVGGSSRVEIIWANGVIADQWLQVTVNADAKTGLSQADVFYFGNAIGDSGNSTTDAAVTIADALAARGRTSANSVSVTSPYDYNRDGLVNGADVAIAQQNLTSGSTVLPLISAPSVSQAIVESVIDPSTPDNDASPTTAIITDPSTSSIDTDNNSSAPVDFVSSPTDGTGSSSDDSGDILYIGGNPGFNESDPVTPTVPFITTTILSDSSASQNTTYDSSSDSDTSTPRSTNDDSTSQTTNTTAPIETPVVIVDPVQGFHLVIVGPTSGIAGKKLGKFTIFAEDAANNILKSANTQVSLSLDVGTLAGHTTRALHHGKAVFSHLSINDSGSYSINASDDIYTSATDSILITARAHRNARMRHHS
jgi:parallel beta-helix repeat protein